jgi:hypothetical protein
MSFVSNDNTHKKLVPIFLSKNQTFVDGMALKQDLAAILQRMKEMPDEERKKYPSNYPPLLGSSVVSGIYDAYSSSWRKQAEKPIPIITPQQNEKIVKGATVSKEAIKNGIPVTFPLREDDYEFVIKVRKMTAGQMKRQFDLSDERVEEILKKQQEEV